MDVHSPKTRSFNMSKIRGKNTKPELLVRKWLWANGFRYRINYEKLPGKPDIIFPKINKVIFINGCFWHKHYCNFFKWPKTNAEFWRNKIEENVKRDQHNYVALVNSGWHFLVIWECSFKNIKKSSLPERMKKIGSIIEEFLVPERKYCMEIYGENIKILSIPSEIINE